MSRGTPATLDSVCDMIRTRSPRSQKTSICGSAWITASVACSVWRNARISSRPSSRSKMLICGTPSSTTAAAARPTASAVNSTRRRCPPVNQAGPPMATAVTMTATTEQLARNRSVNSPRGLAIIVLSRE